MAKRKYVKENNLVKAINTDSLELQKPLVNEYYDINVHNSNMDKIDLAIKQNKNNISENKTSILSIKNLENEEVEVRKIETEENFIAVEDTKNGYFTDIKLEGKTLVVNENNEVVEAGTSGATIKSVGQDVNEISVLSGLPNTKKIIVTNFEVGNINSNDGSDLESSNLARSIEYIPTNGSKFALVKWRLGFDKFVCYNENKNILPSGGYRTILKEGDIFYMSLNDNVKYIRVVANIDSLTNSPNVKCEISLLDSQDKKRILYYNSDTKAWEKPVLRKWDTIEKHSDGKYYYHKRSGEVTLNGSENWVKDVDYEGVPQYALSGCLNPPSPTYEILDVIHNSDCDILVSLYTGVFLVKNISTIEELKTWLQSNPVTVVYQLAEEKVYECTNLDLISYQGETNYIVNTGAITPKSSFNVNDGVSDVVKLLQQRTALGETHEHEYQKHKLTNDSGHHVRVISNANDEYAQRYTCFLYQWGGDNRPTDSSFNILNISNGSTLQHQLYFRVDGSIYCRCRLNSSWTNWQKITTSSTFSLLEEQVATLETQATENENKISILECENQTLKEELTQIQTSIASLTSLLAVTLEEK